MIKRIVDFFLNIITKFIEWMISTRDIEEYVQNEIDENEHEFQELTGEIIRILNFDLSFEREVLENQERIWMKFIKDNKIPFCVKKNILNFIKSEYNLNSKWSINGKPYGDKFEYELLIEFFSPDELRKIQEKKLLNTPKINLEFTVLPPSPEENLEEYIPNYETLEPQYHQKDKKDKKDKKEWNGDWYKDKKEFKAHKKEDFSKKNASKEKKDDGWFVQNRKK